MFILFIDESGDHSLNFVDPQYPVFVLGGCIVDLEYHEKVMSNELSQFKRHLFGRDDFILHTADIARRRGPFKKLTDNSFRARFYEETNKLMKSLEYMVIACAIKKDEHMKQYGLAAMDPYMLSLRVLVERFVYEIQFRGRRDTGHIIAEARDETLDNQLRLAWMELRTTGTEYITATNVRKNITELHIRDKKQNIPGLQIADLIVSPIGRHLIGKKPREDWKIIQSKFRKSPSGEYLGYGLVILPKKIRTAPE